MWSRGQGVECGAEVRGVEQVVMGIRNKEVRVWSMGQGCERD